MKNIKLLITILLFNLINTSQIISIDLSDIPIVGFIQKINKLKKTMKKIDKTIDHKDHWKQPNLNLKYNEVSWLSSHNAFSSVSEGYFPYYQQVYDLYTQLNKLGVRCLLIDLYPTKPKAMTKEEKKTPVIARLCHGPCKVQAALRMTLFMKDIKSYYEDNWWWTALIQIATGVITIGVPGLGAAISSAITGKQLKYIANHATTRTAKNYFKQIKYFLDKNPNEIITVHVENYCYKIIIHLLW